MNIRMALEMKIGPRDGADTVAIFTYADHVLADGVEVTDLFLFRSVDDDNGGTKDTEEAANLTMKVQLFLEQRGGENSTV